MSGGIDSSLISIFATKFNRLKLFSVGFEYSEYDETGYAKEVSKFLNCEHIIIKVKFDDFREILENIVEIYDEPFADSSSIAVYYISREISKYVKTALSGDGGDELFGGYKRYLEILNYFRNFSRLKQTLFHSISKFYNNETISYFSKTPIERYKNTLNIFFSDFSLRKLLNKKYHSLLEYQDHLQKHLKVNIKTERELLNYIQELDFGYYLPENCLVKVDRASMRNSLEIRTPFLDKLVFETSKKIPYHFRIDKFILRKILSKYVPSVAFRNKKGFSVPMKYWLLNYNFNINLPNEIFNLKYIKQIINEHKNGIKNHQSRIYAILILNKFFKKL